MEARTIFILSPPETLILPDLGGRASSIRPPPPSVGTTFLFRQRAGKPAPPTQKGHQKILSARLKDIVCISCCDINLTVATGDPALAQE